MSRLLTVSRAARLVGVSRNQLQKQIANGELQSFEGMVDIDELGKLYADVELEDNTIIEKIETIIDNALKKARGGNLRKLLAPDLSTLARRVVSLYRDLNRQTRQTNALLRLIEETRNKLAEIENNPQKEQIAALREHIRRQLDSELKDSAEDALSMQDAVLRVIAAQVHLLPSGHEFFVEGNQSILEAALSAGLAINYGCSNGHCGKCKSRLISGEVKKIRQHDYALSEEDQAKNMILTCSNTAITDVVLQAEEAVSTDEIPLQKISARVKKIDRINDQLAVLYLRIPRTQRLRFLSGQRVRLSVPGLEPVDYHIASCPCDGINLEFHICHTPGNAFAEQVFSGMQNSQTINIEGPHGEFILYEDTPRPILFIAFDTGFAPIKSLIEHAMTLDANEFFHLYWIHHAGDHPYLHNRARAWYDAFDNFRYTPLRREDLDADKDIHTLMQHIEADYPRLDEFDIYACGNPEQVETLRQSLRGKAFPEKQLITEVL